MYALPNKTQHKLIAKVRGGISQKLDNLSAAAASSATTPLLPTPFASSSSSSANKKTTPDINSRDFSFASAGSSSNNASKDHSSSFAFDGSSVFKSELNSCLPQPVFHHANYGNSSLSTTASKKFAQKQQCITPEHNEMIKYVEQSWKGVERDYKKSVNTYINNIDINNSSSSTGTQHSKQKQNGTGGKKKTAPASTPLLLTGSYHHTSGPSDSTGNTRQDSFRPFDLETFWGNRILKRLTQDL